MNKYDELLDRAKMFYDQPMVGELMNAVRELKERPDIVRCNECIFRREPQMFGTAIIGELLCSILGVPMNLDNFCSYGEKKDG